MAPDTRRWNFRPVITDLSMDDRLAMCNMAIEAGAKNGIIEPDDCTEKYIKDRAQREYKFYYSDADCEYLGIHEYDVSTLSPRLPYLIYLRIYVRWKTCLI